MSWVELSKIDLDVRDRLGDCYSNTSTSGAQIENPGLRAITTVNRSNCALDPVFRLGAGY
jgi:hypothetical protein